MDNALYYGDNLDILKRYIKDETIDLVALAESDPYQFQWWALGLVGARPVEQKKGADKGIDGKIIFQGDTPGAFETVVLSVKAGGHVRDLKGVLEREKAAIGVLISMGDPTKPMQAEAVTGGFYESKTWGKKYPKIQLLTIADLLAGKSIDMPPIRQVEATFKKSQKHIVVTGEQKPIKFKRGIMLDYSWCSICFSGLLLNLYK